MPISKGGLAFPNRYSDAVPVILGAFDFGTSRGWIVLQQKKNNKPDEQKLKPYRHLVAPSLDWCDLGIDIDASGRIWQLTSEAVTRRDACGCFSLTRLSAHKVVFRCYKYL